MLKIEVIYDQGTAQKIEDGFIIKPPFFGVIDGTSGTKGILRKKFSFGKLSGGEMAKKIILETFYSAKANESLEKIILRANKKLGKFWLSHKIPLNHSDLLPGAAFVFVKINSKKIEIIQGGDCFIVIEMKNMTDEQIGHEVYRIYREFGLCGLLSAARKEERRIHERHYITHAEATAIALDFSDE